MEKLLGQIPDEDKDVDTALNDGTTYKGALSNLESVRKNMPTYANSYEKQLSDLYRDITNRKPFSYNLNEDALYEQYREQYVSQGKLAMEDAMGQAASMTGGYGNSYAQSVGQQTYQGYLQKLNEIVPQLEERAYSRYNDEYQRLLNQYSMVDDMADDEYGKYLDSLKNYWNNVDYWQGVADNAYKREYTERSDARNAVLDIAKIGGTPTDEQLAAANWTLADVQSYIDDYNTSLQLERDSIDAQNNEAYYKYLSDQEDRNAEWFESDRKEFIDMIKTSGREASLEELEYYGLSEADYNAYRNYYFIENPEEREKYEQTQRFESLKTKITETGYEPTEEELEDCGMTAEEASEYLAEYKKANPPTGFTGSSRNEAVAYLKEKGVPESLMSLVLSPNDWVDAKTHGDKYARYDTYEDYLREVVEYIMSYSDYLRGST